MLEDWHALGEVVYRKWQVYDMGWGDEFNIDDFIICGAPFGGPLAMIRAEDKLNKVVVVPNATKEMNKESVDGSESNEHLNTLWIFSTAGKLLAEVEFGISNKNNVVVAMHWTEAEQLVLVMIDGSCLMFNLQGKMLTQFLLWDSTSSVHVLECKFWGDGIAAIASDLSVFTAEVRTVLSILALILTLALAATLLPRAALSLFVITSALLHATAHHSLCIQPHTMLPCWL